MKNLFLFLSVVLFAGYTCATPLKRLGVFAPRLAAQLSARNFSSKVECCQRCTSIGECPRVLQAEVVKSHLFNKNDLEGALIATRAEGFFKDNVNDFKELSKFSMAIIPMSVFGSILAGATIGNEAAMTFIGVTLTVNQVIRSFKEVKNIPRFAGRCDAIQRELEDKLSDRNIFNSKD